MVLVKLFLLEAGILTDVVSGLVAPQVVPEVVPEDGEEGVVDLHHAEAHLPAVAVAVGLTIGPVKPVHCGVVAVPGPHSGGVLAVATLGVGSEPEESVFSNLSLCKQLGLHPVAQPWVAGLRDPGPVMEGAQDVGVLPGDTFGGPEQEAAAVAMSLVQLPPVGAVEGVLSHGGGKEGGEGNNGELHV